MLPSSGQYSLLPVTLLSFVSNVKCKNIIHLSDRYFSTTSVCLRKITTYVHVSYRSLGKTCLKNKKLHLSPADCKCLHPPSSNCRWRCCPATAGMDSSSCSYRTLRNWTVNGPSSNDRCNTRTWSQQEKGVLQNDDIFRYSLKSTLSNTVHASHRFKSQSDQKEEKNWPLCFSFL